MGKGPQGQVAFAPSRLGLANPGAQASAQITAADVQGCFQGKHFTGTFARGHFNCLNTGTGIVRSSALEMHHQLRDMQGFVKPENVHFEVLHLTLNQGNCFWELTRNVLHWVFRPKSSNLCRSDNPGDYRVVDLDEEPAELWPAPASGTIQPETWLEKGFDFQWFIESIFPSGKMSRPLTGYHGAQIELMFRERENVWGHSLMEGLFTQLRQAATKNDKYIPILEFVTTLPVLWDAISTCHAQLNSPAASLNCNKLASGIEQFRDAAYSFVEGKSVRNPKPVPKPFRYVLKAYDHILISHMLDEAIKLKRLGLAPVVMSSRFIEANNKNIKAMSRSLPGGGVKIDDNSHLPLVQCFKKLVASNSVERRAWYLKLAKEIRALQAQE